MFVTNSWCIERCTNVLNEWMIIILNFIVKVAYKGVLHYSAKASAYRMYDYCVGETD